MIAATGAMMGAVINANIFGELSMMIGSIGKREKELQSAFDAINSVMIELKLPHHIQ